MKNTSFEFNCIFFSFIVCIYIANILEKLEKDFLWGMMRDESKFHLVNLGGGGGVFSTKQERIKVSYVEVS